MKAVSLSLLTKPYDYWIKKNWYYHTFFARFYQFIIPAGSTVLQVNCKNGYLLSSVKPSVGVGIETDEQCIIDAQRTYPNYTFFHGELAEFESEQTFDYIILSSTTMEVDDIQDLFESLQRFCHPRTRVVIDSYAVLWEPILRLTQKLQLRRPTPLKNWISANDMNNFLRLANFEIVTSGNQLLLPMYIPGISWLCNSIIALIPFINNLCLSRYVIARPLQQIMQQEEYSVSVIIPCRNERGNIEAAVQRTPELGSRTELIFVEGHSQDDTLTEIKRVIQKYPEKNISYCVQPGKGKGDAVRKGFDLATGDILIILDADLTVCPEELPKFYDALVRGKGDFINGSRLVYGMESQAMRWLNLIANYLFGVGFSWLLNQPIKDTLCGTKVLFKKDYETIARNRAFFGDFDPFGDFDLLFGAAKQNFKIIDMPIRYKNRTYGTTQISRFRHGVLLLRMSFVAFRKFKFR